MGQEPLNFLPAQDLDGLQPGEPQAGPSWARKDGRADWRTSASDDDLTAALDPMAMQVAIKAAVAKGGAAIAADTASIEQAAGDSIRAMLLIRTYRVRGHLAADLDPLGLVKRTLPADLSPEFLGFDAAALARKVYLGGTLGLQWATIAEVVEILRANYCGKVGLEYMHIADVEERRFLQERMEGADKTIDFTPEGKKAILASDSTAANR
jgi:2-oxoglutarate dehydrogenase E1 component